MLVRWKSHWQRVPAARKETLSSSTHRIKMSKHVQDK
jgi:hypothetical protein